MSGTVEERGAAVTPGCVTLVLTRCVRVYLPAHGPGAALVCTLITLYW